MRRTGGTSREEHRFHTGPRLFSTLHRTLRAWLEAHGVAEAETELVQIATAELAANVAEHGYDGREGAPILVAFRLARDGRIEFSLFDRAPRFSPEDAPAADLDELARAQAVRGRGIPLIDMIASSFDSRPRPGGGNIWTLIFEPGHLARIVEAHLGQAA